MILSALRLFLNFFEKGLTKRTDTGTTYHARRFFLCLSVFPGFALAIFYKV